MNNYLSLKEIKQLYEARQEFRHKCECGHTVYIMNKSGRAECNHCHRLVFKDKATEFKYIMNRKLIEERRNRK